MKKSENRTFRFILIVPILIAVFGLAAVVLLIQRRETQEDITFCLILTACTMCYVLILSFYIYRIYKAHRNAQKKLE